MRLSARTKMGLVATILLAVTVAWRLGTPVDAEAVASRTTTPQPAPTRPTAASEGPIAAEAAQARTQLPPQGTPLPALWDTLGRAARAGDAPSACRLALTTLNCAAQDAGRRFRARLRTAPPQGELQAMQAFVADPLGLSAEVNRAVTAELEQRIERLDVETERFCGPISEERRSEAFALLRQAALSGVPDAQTAYVLWGAGFTPLMEGTMAEPTFERWLEEAPTILARMLDAGHPDAPGLLAEGYGRDGRHGWLYPSDPMRAVAYGQLAQRIGQARTLGARFLDIRRSALSSSQRADADRLAERLFTEKYAGQALPPSSSRRESLGFLYLGIGPMPTGKVDECAASSPKVTP
jgi:hypothetical protein